METNESNGVDDGRCATCGEDVSGLDTTCVSVVLWQGGGGGKAQGRNNLMAVFCGKAKCLAEWAKKRVPRG